MNLITALQVVKYSPLDDHVNLTEVERHIEIVQRLLKKNYLGDLYDLLEADVADLSCVKNWSAKSTYSQNDKVVQGDTYYSSNIDNNTSEPCVENWTVIPQFTTACYQSLWNNGLKYYLAYSVAATAIPFITYRVGNKGVVEFLEDESGIRSAGKNTMGSTQTSYYQMADYWLEELKTYISNNKATCTDYKKVKTNTYCNEEEVTRKRRIESRFGI